MINTKAAITLAGFALSMLVLGSTARAENQFKMRMISDPQTFDWTLAHTDMETPITMNIMEGLAEFETPTKVKPALAESWLISADRKTYTFKLRKGVKWSDGKELTAEDFIYSWRRLLDPFTAAPYAYILFDIEGAEEFNSRKVTDFAKVGVKAIDSGTIQVKLRRPVSYFLQLFSFWVTFPLRQDIVEKYGPSWSQPGKIVVLGPFIPASYQPQTQIVLKRNELYYGRRPMADSILMRIVNEDSTALNLFKSGQLDTVRPLNFLEMGDLVRTPAFHSDIYLRTCFVAVNTKKYPFTLPKFRQAIGMAIDKSEMAKILHRNVENASSLVPPVLFPPGKDAGLPFNPAGAQKLLAETGITASTIGKIDFYTWATDENALLAQFIQDQLKKNLGLNVELHMPEFKMFRQQLELGTSHLYQRCWGADYADPDTFFGVFLSTSGNNRTGWGNPQYDKLVTGAATMPDGVERTKNYKDALTILLRQDTPIIPLYYDRINYLLNPRIKNYSISPLNYVFFRDIVFTK